MKSKDIVETIPIILHLLSYADYLIGTIFQSPTNIPIINAIIFNKFQPNNVPKTVAGLPPIIINTTINPNQQTK